MLTKSARHIEARKSIFKRRTAGLSSAAATKAVHRYIPNVREKVKQVLGRQTTLNLINIHPINCE